MKKNLLVSIFLLPTCVFAMVDRLTYTPWYYPPTSSSSSYLPASPFIIHTNPSPTLAGVASWVAWYKPYFATTHREKRILIDYIHLRMQLSISYHRAHGLYSWKINRNVSANSWQKDSEGVIFERKIRLCQKAIAELTISSLQREEKEAGLNDLEFLLPPNPLKERCALSLERLEQYQSTTAALARGLLEH